MQWAGSSKKRIAAAAERNNLSQHHRFLLRQSLKPMAFLEEEIAEVDKEILQLLEAYH
jgi:hypothetical protein